MEKITRKTISFPSQLAIAIDAEARKQRRRFSPQVIKFLEDFFCKQASDASRKKGRK